MVFRSRRFAILLGIGLSLLAGRSARSAAQGAAPETTSPDAELGELAESVAFAVGDRIVTRSELEVEARLVLVASGGVNAAFAKLDAQTITSVQAYLINQLLILEEVNRLGVFEAAPGEVGRELELLRRRFASAQSFENFLQSQDVSLDRIRSILERNLRVGRYLDTRVKMSVNVTDADVRTYYDNHRQRFHTESFEGVREMIRGYLFAQRYEDAVGGLMQRLRRHAEVQVLETPTEFPAVEVAPPSPEAAEGATQGTPR